MKLAVFPGSFDPFTKGHQEVADQAIRIFDKLIIAVGLSSKSCLFDVSERVAMITEIQTNPKITVESFDGLVVDFAKTKGATALVRGLRTESDFSYEMPMAMTNRQIEPSVQTIFLPTNSENHYVSSSIVKQVARFQGDVTPFVHKKVKERLQAKFAEV